MDPVAVLVQDHLGVLGIVDAALHCEQELEHESGHGKPQSFQRNPSPEGP